MATDSHKECRKCGERKPASEFYRHARQPGGLRAWCKVCEAKQVRTPKGRAQQREKAKRFRERHPEKYREINRLNGHRWREKNPERLALSRLVTDAIRTGKLQRPDVCESCGGNRGKGVVQAHHRDYSKPLEVEWLCQPCHLEQHRTEVAA